MYILFLFLLRIRDISLHSYDHKSTSVLLNTYADAEKYPSSLTILCILDSCLARIRLFLQSFFEEEKYIQNMGWGGGGFQKLV